MSGRVLLGMSGGIDSSVAAILLQDQGYEVVGITFMFSGNELANDEVIRDAGKLAGILNIKHIVSDFRVEFRNTVIDNFIDQYKNWQNPFSMCNLQPKS